MHNYNIVHFLGVICVLMVASIAVAGEAMTPGEWIPVSSAVESKGMKAYGAVLGNCDDGDWAAFGPLDLADGLVDRWEIELASPNKAGKVLLLLDSPSGAKVGEVDIRNTGGYNTYAVHTGHAEQLSGNHRIVLVCRGDKNLCNIKAFRLLKPGQKSSPNTIAHEPKTPDPKDLKSRIEAILADNKEEIEHHRTTMLTVRTSPGAEVHVKQMRHQFEFGTAINKNGFVPNDKMIKTDQEKYKRVLKANFNSVVHENAMKWYSNERKKDALSFSNADTMLDWCEKNGLFSRGHCVYWGRDKLVQQWIKDLDDNALRKKLQERAKVYMTRYKGRIPEHDINNEMVHCTYFKKRLGGEIWKQMFDWCHQYDSEATLYVNDYSILSGGDTGRYITQIKGFLKSGMKVGGIGVQGHFGSRVNATQVKSKLDQLAQFGLPIKVTEFDINTADEQAKALGLTTLYATAFAHPAVKGIYMWGFWKKCHWRPKAGLWNEDWSETPAATAYRDLVLNRWWTTYEGKADANGICKIRVFFGEHNIGVNGQTSKIKILSDRKNFSIDCRSRKPTDWKMQSGN